MTKFNVYVQLPPKALGKERGKLSVAYESELKLVMNLYADNATQAIAEARKTKHFRFARRDTLAAFPIVEAVVERSQYVH